MSRVLCGLWPCVLCLVSRVRLETVTESGESDESGESAVKLKYAVTREYGTESAPKVLDAKTSSPRSLPGQCA